METTPTISLGVNISQAICCINDATREVFPAAAYLQNWARPSYILRLADFYLYYAEACNEVNPSDPNIIKYLDLVRDRAGIPGYKKITRYW